MAGRSPVNTARDAIMRVGIGPALAFAAASGLRKGLRRALPEYGLTDGQLWRHSVASALAVEPIVRRVRTPVPPVSFTAALIRDIGNCGQWKLPERLMNGVTFHHTPDEGNDGVCDVVYLANVAAKRIGEGVVRGPAEVVASDASFARLGLTSTVWEDLLLTLPAAFEATLAQYTKD
jgi:HD-like signal output (HDOD) protein